MISLDYNFIIIYFALGVYFLQNNKYVMLPIIHQLINIPICFITNNLSFIKYLTLLYLIIDIIFIIWDEKNVLAVDDNIIKIIAHHIVCIIYLFGNIYELICFPRGEIIDIMIGLGEIGSGIRNILDYIKPVKYILYYRIGFYIMNILDIICIYLSYIYCKNDIFRTTLQSKVLVPMYVGCTNFLDKICLTLIVVPFSYFRFIDTLKYYYI